MAETDPAWLVALSRRSDAGLKTLPPTSQPAWYRVRVYEPRLVEESEAVEETQQHAVGA